MNFPYKFNSQACNLCNAKCCRGESGYIFLTKEEGQKIADFLKIDFNKFLEDYTYLVTNKISLKEIKFQNEYLCIFLDKNNKCEIYDFRPKQCKTFPFWNYYRDNVEELKKECIGVFEI
jgi:Fe-S-cluster containining protein